ncbi:amidase [Litoribrevibacter albus]|uniref:6-aminohexanoate-cyclic-dimer hydrolase n=1 Tax=Litoribrevibacter albus TaxID=1473156 RepID=A0AA37S892_9GAMM|nr:amidase [Litoribrevibacter albus]GLQ30501.1 6-aminohexanoate-cyclic-dimer hydrolase [Litoribrevibacter albus]
MVRLPEYDDMDAVDIAHQISTKALSVKEVVEAAIDRIEVRNPQINSIVTSMVERWPSDFAKTASDSPLYGVPFLLKDLVAAFEGVPFSCGSRVLADYIPDHDSEMVTRFKHAGLIHLGKTNTPEFGLMGVTEPELFGPSRNPWNTAHTPGGSSGGSAAAVASRIVPIASAGDGGGSIRIPASCCGVFGLKPSRGRTPTGPDQGQLWQGAAVEHVLTRSVRDSALMLDLTAGLDQGGHFPVALPDRPYSEVIKEAPRKLTLAFSTNNPTGGSLHPECLRAVEKTAQLLRSLGHEVEEATPEYDAQQLYQCYLSMNLGETAAAVGHIEEELGRSLKPGQDIEVMTAMLVKLGKAYSAKEFAQALHAWNQYARAMGKFHQKYDLYLTPTMADLPAKVGELMPTPIEKLILKGLYNLPVAHLLKRTGVFEQLAFRQLEKLPFTQLANLTGQPAMSVPVHWADNGLPVGVQFMAPMGDETTLFQVAAQLEAELQWQQHKPAWLAAD